MNSSERRKARRLHIHEDGHWSTGLVKSGDTIMISGFGEPGTPYFLIDRLTAEGPVDLTIIKNDANEAGQGVGHLLRAGLLERLITSHIGLNPEMVAAMEQGDVAVEFQPQGILAEKIRCGGVGIPAFLSDIGVGVLDAPGVAGAEKRELLDWHGEQYFIERALRADVALLHAYQGDRFGNLRYRRSARNFAPLMALAADLVIVEIEELLDGALDPESVHTPGCFVDHLIVPPTGFVPPTRAAGLRGVGHSG